VYLPFSSQTWLAEIGSAQKAPLYDHGHKINQSTTTLYLTSHMCRRTQHVTNSLTKCQPDDQVTHAPPGDIKILENEHVSRDEQFSSSYQTAGRGSKFAPRMDVSCSPTRTRISEPSERRICTASSDDSQLQKQQAASVKAYQCKVPSNTSSWPCTSKIEQRGFQISSSRLIA
jgi:hypothetical protein